MRIRLIRLAGAAGSSEVYPLKYINMELVLKIVQGFFIFGFTVLFKHMINENMPFFELRSRKSN